MALVCVWLWLSVAHGAEAPAKFLFAYGAIGGNAVPLWIAKEQNIFRKYNLEPQLIYIIAGRAMQSMLAGDIQFGLLGATHVTNAVSAGGDMVMLLGMEEKLNYFLNVRPGIKSADDLKGKKIGIGTPSGSLALATYTGLDHLGLVPRRDRITLLNTGSTPERMSAYSPEVSMRRFSILRSRRSSRNKVSRRFSIWAKRMYRFRPRAWPLHASICAQIRNSSKISPRPCWKASRSCKIPPTKKS